MKMPWPKAVGIRYEQFATAYCRTNVSEQKPFHTEAKMLIFALQHTPLIEVQPFLTS